MRRTRQTRKATTADRARSLELLVAALLGTSTAHHVPVPSSRPSATGGLSTVDGAPPRPSPYPRRPASEH